MELFPHSSRPFCLTPLSTYTSHQLLLLLLLLLCHARSGLSLFSGWVVTQVGGPGTPLSLIPSRLCSKLGQMEVMAEVNKMGAMKVGVKRQALGVFLKAPPTRRENPQTTGCTMSPHLRHIWLWRGRESSLDSTWTISPW